MPRDSARTLRPRQTVDYSQSAENKGGTNTPTWVKGTGKESLRHRAARQSLSKRSKSLPDAAQPARKQRSNSGGQNQPPNSQVDGSIRESKSHDSASSQPVSSTPPVTHPVRVWTKPARNKTGGQQPDKRTKTSKRQAAGVELNPVKRRKTSATDTAADATDNQLGKGKSTRRGKLKKPSRAHVDADARQEPPPSQEPHAAALPEDAAAGASSPESDEADQPAEEAPVAPSGACMSKDAAPDAELSQHKHAIGEARPRTAEPEGRPLPEDQSVQARTTHDIALQSTHQPQPTDQPGPASAMGCLPGPSQPKAAARNVTAGPAHTVGLPASYSALPVAARQETGKPDSVHPAMRVANQFTNEQLPQQVPAAAIVAAVQPQQAVPEAARIVAHPGNSTVVQISSSGPAAGSTAAALVPTAATAADTPAELPCAGQADPSASLPAADYEAFQMSLNGLQTRYDELKTGRIEGVEAVVEAERQAASRNIASLKAACEGWKAEAHRQQQRVESLNPEGFRHQIRQWRNQALEEQQRFKQAEAAYRAEIQQLQEELLQQRTAHHPAPHPTHAPGPPPHHPTHAAEVCADISADLAAEGAAQARAHAIETASGAAAGLSEKPAGSTSPHHPHSHTEARTQQQATSQDGICSSSFPPDATAGNVQQDLEADAASLQDPTSTGGADQEAMPGDQSLRGSLAGGALREDQRIAGKTDANSGDVACSAAAEAATAAVLENSGPGCITAKVLAAALGNALAWAGNLHARQAASPAQRCGSLGSPSMYSLSADPSTPPGQVPVSNNGATDASHLDAFGAGPRLATAPVAHPELLASTARFRPAPRVASDKASAPSPQSPGGSTPAVGTSPLEEFPVPPPPTLVPYSISARVDCNTAHRPLVAYSRGIPTGGPTSEKRTSKGRNAVAPPTRASAPRRRSRFFAEAVEGQGLLSNPEPGDREGFEGFGHVRQLGPSASPSSPVLRSPQGTWDGAHLEGSHSVAVSNVTSRPSLEEQMCPLQLNFSPGSPHNGRPSKAGSPLPVDIAIMPSEAMQPEQQGPGPMTLAILPAKEGEEEDVDAAAVLAADRQALQMQVVRTGQEAAQEHEVREALESLVGLQVHPCGHDTLRFSHGSGFAFELGPASPADSWMTGEDGTPNTRYLPLSLGSTAEALPSHLQEEIEFDAVQKPIFMSHILRALAHWQTGLQQSAEQET